MNSEHRRPINGCPPAPVPWGHGFLVDRPTLHVSTVQASRRATGWLEWLSRQVLISGESGASSSITSLFKCIKDCFTDSLPRLTMSERVPPAAAGMLHGIVLALQHSTLAYHFRF